MQRDIPYVMRYRFFTLTQSRFLNIGLHMPTGSEGNDCVIYSKVQKSEKLVTLNRHLAFKVAILLTVGALNTAPALSLDVSVQTRNYTYTCSSYSQVLGEAVIYARDLNLPKNSQLILNAGWSGYRMVDFKNQILNQTFKIDNKSQQPILWADRLEIPMSVSQNGIYQASLSHALAQKNNNEFFVAIDFVFQVILPNGTSYFEKGSPSKVSFFRSLFSIGNKIPCVDFGISPPGYQETSWRVIKKD